MFFIMSVFAPIILLYMIDAFISDMAVYIDDLHSLRFWISLLPYSLIVFILLNKDYYRAKSISKRIYGYQILNIQTKEIADPTKCMLRNITMFLWPLEVIVLLFNPMRRIGDLIAGTIVVNAIQEQPESILDDMQNSKNQHISTLLIFFFITIILVGLCMI